MKKQILIAFVVTALFQAGLATAAGVAKFKSTENGESVTTVFEYLDKSTARMNVPSEDGGESYMLFRDGKALVVANTQGQTLVMDMAKLSSMADSFGASAGQQTQSFSSSVRSMKPTGRFESVAGIKGEIYKLEWTENGKNRTDNLVLTKNKSAIDYTRAWMGVVRTIEKSGSKKQVKGDQLFAKIEKKKMGILRLGDRFELVSVKLGKPDASRFKVPKATMEMPDLGSLMGGAAMPQTGAPAGSDAAKAAAAGGGFWGGLKGKFKKKSDRQVNRQENRTDNMVDSATDQAADKAIDETIGHAVDSVFKKIFK